MSTRVNIRWPTLFRATQYFEGLDTFLVRDLPEGIHLTPHTMDLLETYTRSWTLPDGVLTGALIESADYLGLETNRLFTLLASIVAPVLETVLMKDAQMGRFGTLRHIVHEAQKNTSLSTRGYGHRLWLPPDSHIFGFA
jgi:hypothetical protein